MSLPTIRYQTPNISIYDMNSEKDKSDVIIEHWKTIKMDILNQLENDNIDILKSHNCMNKSLTCKNRLLQTENCYGCNLVKEFMEDFYVDDSKEIRVQTGDNRDSVIKIFSYNNADVSSSKITYLRVFVIIAYWYSYLPTL